MPEILPFPYYEPRLLDLSFLPPPYSDRRSRCIGRLVYQFWERSYQIYGYISILKMKFLTIALVFLSIILLYQHHYVSNTPEILYRNIYIQDSFSPEQVADIKAGLQEWEDKFRGIIKFH